jgi:hypothetical protein
MSEGRVVDLFVEDRAHEFLVGSLVRRIAAEESRSVELRVRAAAGGQGRAMAEFGNYQSLLLKQVLPIPHLIVVAIDANCARFRAARQAILDATRNELKQSVVAACPDPHVERWYMADPPSFRRVVGGSPRIKQKKCVRDYYKHALTKAVRNAGHPPTLNGIEFAADLAEAMDLYAAGKTDRSLNAFVSDLRAAIRRM